MTASLSEFERIAKLFAPLATAPGAFGLKDDAAVIAPRAGHDLIVTTDTVVEGVDFLASDPPDSIARKALRVNLSDLAAKGARPLSYLLNLSLRRGTELAWLEDFARGLGDDQEKYRIELLGGDMSSTPGPLTIAITAFGAVPEGTMIRRAGAKPGDLVFVTGTIGDSGGGLALLTGAEETISAAFRDTLTERYRLPEPPVSFGPLLRDIVSAALDVSDGLIADLGHLAAASAVRVLVEAARIPLSPALAALWGHDTKSILRAATAGDDYQIAFTAPPSAEAAILEAAETEGIAVARIGRVETGSGVALVDSAGREIPVTRAGYAHF